AVNLVLALFPWLESSSQPSAWSAKIGVGLQRIRQLMTQGTPARREVSTTLRTAGAQWSQQWMTIDYRFSFTGADVPGTRPASPSTLQTLLASFKPDPHFTLRSGLAEGQLRPTEARSRYASLGFDWQLDSSWTISGGCDVDLGSGSERSSKHGCSVSGGFAERPPNRGAAAPPPTPL